MKHRSRRPLSFLLLITLSSLLLAAKCDQGQLDRACLVDPTLPFCKPSPPPSTQPGPEPTPSAPPTPEASSPPPPSPVPSAAPTPPPSPEPTPNPEPSWSPFPTPPPPQPGDCVAVPGNAPVPLNVKRPGFEAFSGPGGVTLYAAKSSGQPSGCHSCASLYNRMGADAYDAKHSLQWDDLRGWFDAYCRRYCEDNGSGRCQAFRLNGTPNLLINQWDYSDACAPAFCATPGPAPSPSPQPSSSPEPPAYSDVNKLLLLNYGKCVTGKPFVFFLEQDPPCKELLVTATPKSSSVCGGKACDAEHHGRNLTWRVTTRTGQAFVVGDEEGVDIGCATVEPGPIEMTFNRTIVGKDPCEFDLTAVLVDPAGKTFTATAHVQVVR